MKTKLKPKMAGESEKDVRDIHITLGAVAAREGGRALFPALTAGRAPVGDGNTGKKEVLKTFAGDGRDVTASDVVSFPITVTGAKDKYILRVFCTEPGEAFARIRNITYKTTDVFLICFDLTDEATLTSARSWYAEVNQLSPKVAPSLPCGPLPPLL